MSYELHCGDCLEIMPTLAKVDAVITDPPYGIRITRNAKSIGVATHTSRKCSDLSWDDSVPSKNIFDEIFKVSKEQIIFGANYFWENFYATQCYVIWDKRGNLPSVPFADTEFAWTSFHNKMPKKYTVINHGFIKDSSDEKTIHPTQKPSELFVRILQDFTKPGDTILDPFMGSGTTGVACMMTGRNFIGIEINHDYFAIAEERIRKATFQPSLFAPQPEQWQRQELFAAD